MDCGKELYTKEEKDELLQLARGSIEAYLSGNDVDNPISQINEKFIQDGSCFVTLHTEDGDLRGCIGNIMATEPLYNNIIHNAQNSAFQDPRFPAVASLEELDKLHIEISILTPPVRIKGYHDYIVGKHGIILQNGESGAVFLPQVAPEQGWDRDTTLTHLCLKAGLARDAWKEPVTLFDVFEAVVFCEN